MSELLSFLCLNKESQDIRTSDSSFTTLLPKEDTGDTDRTSTGVRHRSTPPLS